MERKTVKNEAKFEFSIVIDMLRNEKGSDESNRIVIFSEKVIETSNYEKVSKCWKALLALLELSSSLKGEPDAKI